MSVDHDPVNRPQHYTAHPSGIGRADLKANAIEDLQKARWYIERELKKRNAELPTEKT